MRKNSPVLVETLAKIDRREVTPPSLVPRAKTPDAGSGGFFVRGGGQKSTMKKSDNIDDHVYMPGEAIGDAFVEEKVEKKEGEKSPDHDGIEGGDRDIRDAKRAANGKVFSYTVRAKLLCPLKVVTT